ncbi:MAG: hypothetical protein J7452_03635, partial [Thermoflexus sp.]|nr:hypothetical protein [Thermoflexus sp.]
RRWMMFTLRVETPVSVLQPACFFIQDTEGRLLARIREIRGGSLLRRLLFYTRFRAALRLILEVEESATGRRLLLERPFILPRMQYRLVAEDGSPIWRFEERGLLIPHYRILSRWEQLVGIFRLRSHFPSILGPRIGHIEDIDGRRMAQIEWREFGWLRGSYREGAVEIYGDPEPWAQIAMWAAVIQGLILQER